MIELQPFTFAIILLNIIITLWYWYDIPFSSVRNEMVFSDNFAYKFFGNLISKFCHATLTHLIVNMFSFYYLSSMELILNKRYLIIILFATIINACIVSLTPFNSIGFSSVGYTLFVYSSKYSQNIQLLDVVIDKRIFAFILIILTQYLVPRTSLISHLSGYCVGMLLLEIDYLITQSFYLS